MKHELIKTENYLLVVSDEEIKEVDWCYYLNCHGGGNIVCQAYKHHSSARMLFDSGNHNREIGEGITPLNGECKKIIAHLPLNDAPYLEGVDVLPPLENETITIVKRHLKHPDFKEYVYFSYENGRFNGAIYGYNLAKETYRYTEEDLVKAITMAKKHDKIPNHDDVVVHFEHSKDEIIQSLNQPKLPVGFVCETIHEYVNTGWTENTFLKPKTITNSDGRTEWVGEYLF